MTTADELTVEMTRRGWRAALEYPLDAAYRYPMCRVWTDDEDRSVAPDGDVIEVYDFGDNPDGGFEPGFRWSILGTVHTAPSSIGVAELADQLIESIRYGQRLARLI
jgi:hypothetical protein